LTTGTIYSYVYILESVFVQILRNKFVADNGGKLKHSEDMDCRLVFFWVDFVFI